MMKYLLLISIAFALSCNKDVDALLLKGTKVDYSFTNADLDGHSVDENLVHQFQVTSKNGDKEETIECLYGRRYDKHQYRYCLLVHAWKRRQHEPFPGKPLAKLPTMEDSTIMAFSCLIIEVLEIPLGNQKTLKQ